MRDHLIIFAKSPVPGTVKTRLAPELSPEEAAALCRAFIADTVDKALSVEGLDVSLAYTPDDAREYFVKLSGGRMSACFPQKGEDLGERMSAAFDEAFGRGADKAALVGTDIPGLEPSHISSAFSLLDDADIVLGPANDGGYYLIGLKAPDPLIFSDIAWSGPEVLSVTIEKAESLGMKVRLLPELIDIDNNEDLLLLPRCGLSPHTKKAIIELERRAVSRRRHG